MGLIMSSSDDAEQSRSWVPGTVGYAVFAAAVCESTSEVKKRHKRWNFMEVLATVEQMEMEMEDFDLEMLATTVGGLIR